MRRGRETAAGPEQVKPDHMAPDHMAPDHVKDACGIFGVYAPGRPVARLTFDGLFALQHRGQESAGMAVSDGDLVTVVKDMGLVASVFDERTLTALTGSLAIGHTRYSTAGASTWRNAQPVFRSPGSVNLALAHNGNLTNTEKLSSDIGMIPGIVTSDSDLVAEMLELAIKRSGAGYADSTGNAPETGDTPSPLEEALLEVLPSLEGAFSLVAMDAQRLFAVRDPNGFRPLCLGRLEGAGDLSPSFVVASETPALDVVGADFVREIEPGEVVVIDATGTRSVYPFAGDRHDPRLCIFEFVYFARPDSILLGSEVHGTRRRMGELLAGERAVDGDMVMGVPDSGLPAAEGFSRASGIPYGQGLVKNRYIGRTFITPGQQARSIGVRRKLNPLKSSIAGKRLVVVDDSIVRGTTTKQIMRMLRDAGAAELHLRISSPPFRWPCFYGIDTPDFNELLASRMSIEEIEEYLGVDSLAYLSLEALVNAIGVGSTASGFCAACLTGSYPVAVRDTAGSQAGKWEGTGKATSPPTVPANAHPAPGMQLQRLGAQPDTLRTS